MRPYETLAKQIHDSAYGDLLAGTRNTDGVLKEAIAALPDLVHRGEVMPQDVAHLNDLLAMPGPPPLDVRDYVSEFNLAGAQALGNLDTIRQVALTRGRVLLAMAQQTNQKTQTAQLRRMTGLALDLAKQWHLEELDPHLVGDLYLQAGNVYMAQVGPVTSDVDRGLQRFLAGYRLKQEGGDPAQLARLADLMRRAAGFLLAQTSAAEVFNADLSRTHDKLQTAVDVLDAVGPPAMLREAQSRLLRFYVARRFLDAAEPLFATLEAEAAGLAPEMARHLALSRADWLSQRHRPAEALAILDPHFAQEAIAEREWPYAQNIRANCYRLLSRFDDAHAAFLDLLHRAEAAAAAEPTSVEPRLRRVLTLTHLGYVDFRRSRLAEGERWFQQAAALFEAGVISWDVQVRHADMWAMARYEAGLDDGALAQYEAALALRQRIEAEMRNPELREGLMGNWAMIDARIIQLCLRLGKPARALEVMEGSKSRVLQEIARLHSPVGVFGLAPASSSAGAGEATPEGGLRRDYALLSTERERLRRELGTVVDAAARLRTEQQLHSVEQQLAGVRELLERTVAGRTLTATSASASVEPLAAQQVLDLVPPATSGGRWGIVSFHSGGDGTAVVLAAPNGLGAPPQIEGRFLEEWPYERLRSEIYDPWEQVRQAYFARRASATAWQDALDQYRQRLYAALWAPIATEIERRDLQHVLVLPHRLLHLVPHAAAQDAASGKDLLETVEAVCVAPGAGFLRAAEEELAAGGTPGQPGLAAIFGRPDGNAALMGLEAGRIARQWTGARGGEPALYLG
ncbi:MAG: CHAT domain-containing protein, partial [Chloroflexota bacterium]